MNPDDQQPTPPQDSPELEALLVQGEQHNKEINHNLETLIAQGEKNNPEPVLEAQLLTLDKIAKSLEEDRSTRADQHQTVADSATVTVKGLKGDQGEKGEQGEKGDKGENGEPGLQGERGPAGVDGRNGQDGRDGKDGLDGKPGIEGAPGLPGAPGTPGASGRDGSPDTGQDIVSKLTALPEPDKLSYEALKDRPNFETFRAKGGSAEFQIRKNGVLVVNQVRVIDFIGNWTIADLGGGAVSAQAPASSAVTVYAETPTGAVNGVNTSYTVAHNIGTVYTLAINGQFIHPGEYVAMSRSLLNIEKRSLL